MSPTDVTVEILKGIRDEVHGISTRLDETNTRRIDISCLRADLVAPALKIRRVVLAKMRERFESLLRSGWIEDNLDQAEETVVFDDEFNIGF